MNWPDVDTLQLCINELEAKGPKRTLEDLKLILAKEKEQKRLEKYPKEDLLFRLDEFATTCPCCGKTIYIPIYRIQPFTQEELRERTQARIKEANREAGIKRKT